MRTSCGIVNRVHRGANGRVERGGTNIKPFFERWSGIRSHSTDYRGLWISRVRRDVCRFGWIALTAHLRRAHANQTDLLSEVSLIPCAKGVSMYTQESNPQKGHPTKAPSGCAAEHKTSKKRSQQTPRSWRWQVAPCFRRSSEISWRALEMLEQRFARVNLRSFHSGYEAC